MASPEKDWAKPQAMAIPKRGVFYNYGAGQLWPDFSHTPACRGFTIIAKLKAAAKSALCGKYADKVEKAMRKITSFLAALKLHYLKWVLFDIKGETYFMYQGVFDTDFDKYTDDAVALFSKSGLQTAFENLEGFPEGIGKRTFLPSSSLCATTIVPVLWSAANIHTSPRMKSKKRSKLKKAFGEMLDQMQ